MNILRRSKKLYCRRRRSLQVRPGRTKSVWVKSALTWLGLLCFTLFLAGFEEASAEAGRYHVMGVTLPQPTRTSSLEPVGRFAIRPTPVTADVWFSLDKKGRVDSIQLEYDIGDSLVFEPFRDSLEALEFLPFERSGKKRKMRLPGRLTVSGPTTTGKRGSGQKSSQAVLSLPVDAVGEIDDPDLVNLALAEVDRIVPELTLFPPYFYSRPSIAEDTAALYPYALVRVALDSSGTPTDRELVFATDTRLGEMILIASGWAEYRGASVEGTGVPSVGYILVSFYREQNYPTVGWRRQADSLADRLEHTRVRWFSTPGIANFELRATPRAAGERAIHLSRDFFNTAPVVGRMFVSEAGRPDVRTLRGPITNRLRTELKRRVLGMRYYPSVALKMMAKGGAEDYSPVEITPKWDTLLFELIPTDTFDYHMRLLEH